MKCRLVVLFLLSGFSTVGCGGIYQYYTEPSPKLENSRYEYVKYNPGAEHNNHILAGKIQPGMTRDEIYASWGNPNAIAPGDRKGVQEVWTYNDPDQSHGNNMWMLRFSKGTLQGVEKLIGLTMAGTEPAPEVHLGEETQPAQSDKPR